MVNATLNWKFYDHYDHYDNNHLKNFLYILIFTQYHESSSFLDVFIQS